MIIELLNSLRERYGLEKSTAAKIAFSIKALLLANEDEFLDKLFEQNEFIDDICEELRVTQQQLFSSHIDPHKKTFAICFSHFVFDEKFLYFLEELREQDEYNFVAIISSQEYHPYYENIGEYIYFDKEDLSKLDLDGVMASTLITAFSPKIIKILYGNDGQGDDIVIDGSIKADYTMAFTLMDSPGNISKILPQESYIRHKISNTYGVIPLGYPKIDHLWRTAQSKNARKEFVFTLMPFDNAHSPFPLSDIYRAIDSVSEKFFDYTIYVRPSPDTRGSTTVNDMMRYYENHDRVLFDLGPYIETYSTSELLINLGYGGSTIQSYTFATERPAIVYNPNEIKGQQWFGFTIDSLDDLCPKIEFALKERNLFAKQIEKYRGEHFVNFGNSSKYFAGNLRHILEEIPHGNWKYYELYSYDTPLTPQVVKDCFDTFSNVPRCEAERKQWLAAIMNVKHRDVLFDNPDFYHFMLPDGLTFSSNKSIIADLLSHALDLKKIALVNETLRRMYRCVEQQLHQDDYNAMMFILKALEAHIIFLEYEENDSDTYMCKLNQIHDDMFKYFSFKNTLLERTALNIFTKIGFTQAKLFENLASYFVERSVWDIDTIKELAKEKYLIYGTGQAVSFLLGFLRYNSLRLPEFIYDMNPITDVLQGIPLKNILDETTYCDLPIGAGSLTYYDEIKKKIIASHPYKDRINIVDMSRSFEHVQNITA